jgi:hypothetical protein
LFDPFDKGIAGGLTKGRVYLSTSPGSREPPSIWASTVIIPTVKNKRENKQTKKRGLAILGTDSFIISFLLLND